MAFAMPELARCSHRNRSVYLGDKGPMCYACALRHDESFWAQANLYYTRNHFKNNCWYNKRAQRGGNHEKEN